MYNMPAAHENAALRSAMVPAVLDSIATVRLRVKEALVDVDCDDTCHGDLQLAADEFASVLILAAAPDSLLHVSIALDDEDVYVRMSVPVHEHQPDPLACDLTRQLLRDTVNSYELWCEGGEIFGVLQRELGLPTGPVIRTRIAGDGTN